MVAIAKFDEKADAVLDITYSEKSSIIPDSFAMPYSLLEQPI